MIVPIDVAGYTNYQSIRANLALPQASLLPLQIGGQANFGLHPSPPEVKTLFNTNKSLGILANVGTRVQPTTQENYHKFLNPPPKLLSPSDQHNNLQTSQMKR